MTTPRGVWQEGWLQKATSSGEPWPLDTRLAQVFQRGRVKTLSAALQLSAELYGSAPCMATRQLCARERRTKDGKTLEKLQLGDYVWSTYSQVKQRADAVAGALHRLHFSPGERVAIFSETRGEWFVACMAALQQRLSVCTIYSTLGDSGVVHALNETEVSLVFISFDLMSKFENIVKQCPKIRTYVVFEDQLDGIGNVVSIPDGIKIVPFKQMTDEKNISAEALEVVPDPEDIAIIMYTSGSTGTPKGVEITHTNILGAVIGYSVQMNVGVGDRYLAYLPLAHIMELATELALISLGVTIYYSSPHTLTSSSPKVMKGTLGDARLAKPTTMNCVPLILDRIIKKVIEKVNSQGWLASSIFHTLVAYKPWIEYVPFTSTLMDLLVFQKVKDELGGVLSRIIVGGAPLSPQTHEMFRAIFGCSIQIGYGSTETASCATGMNEDDMSTGHVGAPCLNVLLRLANWDEGNYMITDKPRPRGEIVIGGMCVAKGYFKLPELTEESFFEADGKRWFKTGDIAEQDENGCLKIIDRKKDLVKLKHGEYVALGNAETILKTCSVVDNICVFADSTKDNVVAVVVPMLNILRQFGVSAGITDNTPGGEDLCSNEQVVEGVLSELQKHGKKFGLSRWEIPAAVYLTNELWTPDSGLVTAALKLRRVQIGHHYKTMVTAMYASL